MTTKQLNFTHIRLPFVDRWRHLKTRFKAKVQPIIDYKCSNPFCIVNQARTNLNDYQKINLIKINHIQKFPPDPLPTTTNKCPTNPCTSPSKISSVPSLFFHFSPFLLLISGFTVWNCFLLFDIPRSRHWCVLSPEWDVSLSWKHVEQRRWWRRREEKIF